MNWVSVDSSVFASVAYRGDKRQLFLRFHSGKVYRYFGFPPDQYDELLAAESKGGYFAESIRGTFLYEEVREADGSGLTYFFQEIGHARIRRTEVRPICKRRAISALLTPARYSFRALSAWSPAVMGRTSVLPFCRAWARPATRSRRISLSNSANTASSAA